MTLEFIYQMIGSLLVAAATYGGIRADIRNHREAIDRAHRRLDDHLERGHS